MNPVKGEESQNVMPRPWLKVRRVELGYHSQEALAEAVGVSRETVNRWEKGHSAPEGENLSRLATVLDRSEEWVLRGESHNVKHVRGAPRAYRSDRVEELLSMADRPSEIRRMDWHMGISGQVLMVRTVARDREFSREELLAVLDKIEEWAEEADATIQALAEEVRRRDRDDDGGGGS